MLFALIYIPNSILNLFLACFLCDWYHVGMFISDNWRDYRIIDAGDGEKLERWGHITVIRPDPQIVWPRLKPDMWRDCHMHYHRSKDGGGRWQYVKKADKWTVSYGDLTFNIRPTDFKHMGLFPEQAANWDWMAGIIKGAKDAGRPVRVLNLFGYTGGATCCCLRAGAEVTHVDAAKGMNQWAKENIAASGLTSLKCRILTDDVYKFVQREKRRGSFYDGIVMDPPSYGRGPSGEVWKIENRLYDLLCACVEILSERALFMLLNTYTTGFTGAAAENVMKLAFGSVLGEREISTTSGPLGLPIGDSDLVLPCGVSVRCAIL